MDHYILSASIKQDRGQLCVPLADMDEQRSSGLLHGFDHDAQSRGHWGIGLLQRVEIQDGIQDFIGNLGTGTD